MRTLKEWFQQGLTKQAYAEQMNVNQEELFKIYNDLTIDEATHQALTELQGKGIQVVVLTADWCGDAMVNVPILMKFADLALIEVRYLNRDENLELMDQYLTNGRARSIPIFVFMNKDGKEIGKWGPRAAFVEQKITELKEGLPEKDTDGYEEAFKVDFLPKARTLFQDESIRTEIQADLLEVMKRLT
ncbi:thioredoxin family protein [Shouchella shacheensis]|uniref:thioredoxin family protein n=1 Tax=Shouchella shacheensis TaxID=1649580 RepID=UPI000B0072DB|nr:thioredoxin family protein [Shouchella shacheensis]